MRSASWTRTFAITLAPAFAANWVAKEPTPPPAPTISTVLSASGSSKSTKASPAPPAVGSAAATTSSSPPGTRASGASSVTATLGVRSRRAKRRDQQLAEQIVADGKPRRPWPELLDHARAIDSEHHRECRRHRLPGAGGKRAIHRVHAGGTQPDQDLSRSRFRRRHLSHRRSGSILCDRDRSHRVLLTVGGLADLRMAKIGITPGGTGSVCGRFRAGTRSLLRVVQAVDSVSPILDRSHAPIAATAASISGTRPAPRKKLCCPSGSDRSSRSTPAARARSANSLASSTSSSYPP